MKDYYNFKNFNKTKLISEINSDTKRNQQLKEILKTAASADLLPQKVEKNLFPNTNYYISQLANSKAKLKNDDITLDKLQDYLKIQIEKYQVSSDFDYKVDKALMNNVYKKLFNEKKPKNDVIPHLPYGTRQDFKNPYDSLLTLQHNKALENIVNYNILLIQKESNVAFRDKFKDIEKINNFDYKKYKLKKQRLIKIETKAVEVDKVDKTFDEREEDNGVIHKKQLTSEDKDDKEKDNISNEQLNAINETSRNEVVD